VAYGANVDEPDSGGNTALHLSLTHLQLSQLTGREGSESDQFMPLIEAIIQRAKKVDHQNELGNTPLILSVFNSCSKNYAERQNYQRIAKGLLEKGANINMKNKYHECALSIGILLSLTPFPLLLFLLILSSLHLSSS
jgi:ankyrin repeat protein